MRHALLAWVLWSHFTFNANDGTPPQERWDRLGAAPTERECLAVLRTAGSPGDSMRLVDSGPTYRVFSPANLKPGHSSTTRFACLPDTTDPREGARQ